MAEAIRHRTCQSAKFPHLGSGPSLFARAREARIHSRRNATPAHENNVDGESIRMRSTIFERARGSIGPTQKEGDDGFLCSPSRFCAPFRQPGVRSNVDVPRLPSVKKGETKIQTREKNQVTLSRTRAYTQYGHRQHAVMIH